MWGLYREVVGCLVKKVPDFKQPEGLFTVSFLASLFSTLIHFTAFHLPPESVSLLYALGLRLILILSSMYNDVFLSLLVM